MAGLRLSTQSSYKGNLPTRNAKRSENLIALCSLNSRADLAKRGIPNAPLLCTSSL